MLPSIFSVIIPQLTLGPDRIMKKNRNSCLLALLLITLPCVGFSQAPIVHPGAPGEPAKTLSAEEATEIAKTAFSPADIRFMQDMIPHHHQAMEMAELVAERTNSQEVVDVAGRINASQSDEIAFMQQWLAELIRWQAWPPQNKWPNSPHQKAQNLTAFFLA
jgi:uncharacterized protein (DUF305 family)